MRFRVDQGRTRRFIVAGSRLLIVCGAVALGACTTPAVPVVGVPGPTKTMAGFQNDEAACRRQAGSAAYPGRTASGNPNVDWQKFFMGYAQCQTGRGNYLQPVPWALAYAIYLGYGLPYPPPVFYR
jgi:hypothetical protein